MKTFIVVSCLVAAAAAQVTFFGLLPQTTQYHAQDALGQYSYGYAGGPSSKAESRTLDGVTRGAYSYVDANGLVQSVNYVADPVNGFRVAATNLPQGPRALAPELAAVAPLLTPTVPQETPEVVAAKIAHFQAHAEARALHSRKRRSLLLPQFYSAPLLAPSNYEVRDNLGQYTYGYNDGNSAKSESRSFDGTTNGGYSYLDGNGLVQTVQYTADSNGFRVAATNLPVGPAVASYAAVAPLAPIATVAAVAVGVPQAPLDTPEVVAAKSAHFAAHAEARARLALAS